MMLSSRDMQLGPGRAHPRHGPGAGPLRGRARGPDLRPRQARGDGPLRRRAGGERAHRLLPPLPAPGRPAHRGRAVRRRRAGRGRPAGGLGGRRQQHGQQLAGGLRRCSGSSCASPARRATTPTRRCCAALRGQGAARPRSPAEAVARRARGEHRRVGQHGPGGARPRSGAARFAGFIVDEGAGGAAGPTPSSSTASRPTVARRSRTTVLEGAAVGGLRRGREPAPRPEGAPRVACCASPVTAASGRDESLRPPVDRLHSACSVTAAGRRAGGGRR